MTNPDREELVKLEARIQYEIAACETLVRAPTMLFSVDDLRLVLRRLASSDGGVKVRELDWRECLALGGGRKLVALDCFGHEFRRIDLPVQDIEVLKNAAQADYEACIKSALVEVPAVKGESEPVAWQYRDHSKGVLASCWQYAAIEPDTYPDREVQPLYTAQPADAGMREALEAAQECIARETTRCIRLEQTIQDTIQSLERGSTSAPVVECLKAALTAPGATTKSDGGVEGHAGLAHGGTAREAPTSTTGCLTSPAQVDAAGIKPGPSEPSSIRSDPNEQAYADLIASGGIFPEAYQQGEASMTDDQIKHMVDRFLMWKLPEHFNPDCGISFDQSYRSERGPVGTNLFSATEATAMVRHMLEDLPSTRSDVTALASLEGDAVERVARMFDPEAFEDDRLTWEDRRVRALNRARRILATGLVPDEAKP